MSKKYHVRILAETEYAEWDQLVELSPGGTVYNTSWWVDMIARLTGARMEIVGCFVGDNLCGGCAAYIRSWAGRLRVVAPPTTPYNGFVLREPATTGLSSATAGTDGHIRGDSRIHGMQVR